MEVALERPVRAPDLRRWKRIGRKIVMLTAYDASLARLLEAAGVDVLLVGDSLGMVVQGHDTTLPVTLDDVIYHSKAVSRAVRRALVVADLPFLTYQTGVDEAMRNAGRLIQEGGAAAVKLEGGRGVVEVVKRITDVGIPVMGHLGLTPQSFHQLGGFRKQAKTPQDADALCADAEALQAAGAFAIVLESIPDDVAERASKALEIPTIGIGAGAGCDGQVLVTHDILGMYDSAPPFAKVYTQIGEEIMRAAAEYAEDVRGGRFPAKDRD